MVSSIWRISARTASIASSALPRSSDHSSTVIRVPMMPSVIRLTHSARAGAANANRAKAATKAVHGFGRIMRASVLGFRFTHVAAATA